MRQRLRATACHQYHAVGGIQQSCGVLANPADVQEHRALVIGFARQHAPSGIGRENTNGFSASSPTGGCHHRPYS